MSAVFVFSAAIDFYAAYQTDFLPELFWFLCAIRKFGDEIRDNAGRWADKHCIIGHSPPLFVNNLEGGGRKAKSVTN